MGYDDMNPFDVYAVRRPAVKNGTRHEYDEDGVCIRCRFDSVEHHWLNRDIPAEERQPAPACPDDWAFERVTFLPDGGISTAVIRLEQRTYREACEGRDEYNAPGVVCGVLYKV